MNSTKVDGTKVSDSVLLSEARAARKNAHSPYSKFEVGAALETEEGKIFTGCNIENASLGLTMCAERVALFKAISEGAKHFLRIAIVTDGETPTSPCGACRQLLWELGGDLQVISETLTGQRVEHQLSQLLPYPFDDRDLGRDPGTNS